MLLTGNLPCFARSTKLGLGEKIISDFTEDCVTAYVYLNGKEKEGQNQPPA